MPLTDGMIGRWENYPTANGDWAATFGGVNLIRSGAVGTAAGKVGHNVPSFDGSGGDILSTTGIALPATFMLASWAWLDSLSAVQKIVVKSDLASNQEFFFSYSPGVGGRFLFILRGSELVQTELFLSSGTWAFLVAWRDAVNSQFGIRLNNGTKNTATITTPTTPANAPLEVGDSVYSSFPMHGRIGPLALWNRILTDTEQDQLWNLGGGIKFGGGAVCGRVVTTPRISGKVVATPRISGKVVTTPRVGGRVTARSCNDE